MAKTVIEKEGNKYIKKIKLFSEMLSEETYELFDFNNVKLVVYDEIHFDSSIHIPVKKDLNYGEMFKVLMEIKSTLKEGAVGVWLDAWENFSESDETMYFGNEEKELVFYNPSIQKKLKNHVFDVMLNSHLQNKKCEITNLISYSITR